VLPAIMDISAPAISLADRPQWAIWVTSVHMRREDRSSISADPLADLVGSGFGGYIIGSSLCGYLTDLMPPPGTARPGRSPLILAPVDPTLARSVANS
jgi:hypothetical protein